MDASSSRLVATGTLMGLCFGANWEIVTSGEVSDAGVKLDWLLLPSLRCSAWLEVGVEGRAAWRPGGGARTRDARVVAFTGG